MAKQFLSDVDLKGALLANGASGALGYSLKSRGPSSPPVWDPSHIVQTSYLITDNVVLDAGKHGMSLISVEIANGFSVEVPSGATWILAVL